MSDKIDLQREHSVAVHPALIALKKDIDYITKPSEGFPIGALHNVLYALSIGPLIPVNDDSDRIMFANKRDGTIWLVSPLRYAGFLSDENSNGAKLNERGKACLEYLNITNGPCSWQQDDAVQARRAAFRII